MRRVGRIKKMKSAAAMFVVISLVIGGNFSYAATRIKDIAYIGGVRENQLYGYGLVVGLNGTGDRQSSFPTLQSIGNMLRRMGMYVSPTDVSSKLKTRNIAAVMVTAQLPPLVRPGTKIDVLVSSIGDATSLANGVLLQTPLQGADGEVYAVAQGPLSTGLGVGGRMRRGAPLTVARIPEGAIVEKEVPSTMVEGHKISIILKQPDFTTASRIVEQINSKLAHPYAKAEDAGIIKVNIPGEFKDRIVEFVSLIENISVEPDSRAKVVINERTGTIVAGQDVRISTVAVSHGNISVQIIAQRQITKSEGSSGQIFGTRQGNTSTETRTEVTSGEGSTELKIIREGVSVYDVVKALNALGVAPKDLIAILQAIKEAGALYADLELI